jgi:hypothetical protein
MKVVFGNPEPVGFKEHFCASPTWDSCEAFAQSGIFSSVLSAAFYLRGT